jgi:hypothetical protein
MSAANTSRRRLIANATSAPDHDAALRRIAAQFKLDPAAIATTAAALAAAGIPRGEARQRSITAALLLWPISRHEPNAQTTRKDDDAEQ